MGKSFRTMQNLLLALSLFALTGCGANSTTSGLSSKDPGKVTANLVMPKVAGKSVASQAAVVKTRLTVTGKDISTARKEFANSTAGSVEVYPAKDLIVTAQAFDTTGAIIYEGFATAVTVLPSATTNVTITLNAPVNKAENMACIACHESTRDVSGQNVVANYKQSGHYTNLDWTANAKNGSTVPGCAGCHGINHNDTDPAASGRCYECHSGVTPPTHTASSFSDLQKSCNSCHNPHSAKIIKPASDVAGCILCHAVGQDATATGAYVNDNNGVRAITTEFKKWSHHVTGVALNDAHCAACHLEAKAEGGSIIIDNTKHMVDAKTHLRNADTDADFAWDPSAPNHSGMDTYCMSCHDANGATSTGSKAIQAVINAKGIKAVGKTASPGNPFGDTISNRYDKMQRPAVVDASSQFNTDNNSHHAVKGPRYTGRTRIEATRRVIDPVAFANNSTSVLFGARMTIYDAVTQDGREAFNALYTPLADAAGEAAPRTGAATLGDDSTLHCGDCHTVGQWKAGVATNAAGVLNTAVIGAHGSNNEYLLRNDKGTDERHTQDAYVASAGKITYQNPNAANLVCFNCHSYSRYGSVFNATGTTGPHAGEYDASGRCNGVGNTIPFNGYTTGTATDGTQFQSRFMGPLATFGSTPAFAPGFPLNNANRPVTGEQQADFGNVFGMQCANCHNSGAGNAYGGIHGSVNNQTLAGYTIAAVTPATAGAITVSKGLYIDGMGNTTKIMRFLPGLGDAMHVPGTLGGMVVGKEGTTAKFIQYSSDRVAAPNTMFTELPVRDNRPAVNAKVGSYNFQTGGVSSDTNWEQKGWKQLGPGSTTNTAQQMAQGAGCYTLGSSAANTPGTITTGVGFLDDKGVLITQRPNVMDDLRGPSQGVAGQPNPELFDNWGGCDDHSAPIGGGNHGFIKRIVRPVTY